MPISETIQLGLMGAGTLVVALLACDTTVDNKKLEKIITEMFDEQLELEVKSIDCPKDVKMEQDKTFECEVKVEPKGKVPVEVEITDAKEGSIEVKTKYKVLNPKKLEKKGLDCGKKVRILKPGNTIKCKGPAGPIELKVNEDGEIET